MTTLSDLRARCRRLIGDLSASVFSDEQLNDWIYAASMDLSLHFPRCRQVEINASPGVHVYDLPADLIDILLVEYPADQQPPATLLRRSRRNPDFWLSETYYDLIPHDDKGDPAQLCLSASPPEAPAAQVVRVDYQAYHQELKSDSEVCTLPDRLQHLIPLFVRWQAWMALSTLEGMDPDPAKLLAATHEVNAGRAERAYREALRQAKLSRSASAVQGWRMDEHDRIY